MNGREKLKIAFVVVALAVIAVVILGALTRTADCEAKGGKVLRGTWAWEGWKCYEAASLKEIT